MLLEPKSEDMMAILSASPPKKDACDNTPAWCYAPVIHVTFQVGIFEPL